MKPLTEKELRKLSVILETEVDGLRRLCDNDLINIPNSRNLLIKSDFEANLSNDRLTRGSIVHALMNEYDASRSKIEAVIYGKTLNKKEICKICGEDMSRYKYHKFNGVCDNCIAKSIKL